MSEVTGPIIAITLGALRGVHPDRVHRRPHRPVLPAVRADDRDLDGAFGVQLADAQPRACGACCCSRTARRRTGSTRVIDRAARAGSSRRFNRLFDAASDGYAAASARAFARSAIALLVYVGLLVLTVLGFRKVPTGFVPAQDKDYLVGIAQLPDGASLDRTEAVMRRMTRDRARAAGRRERGRVPRLLDQRLRRTARTPA